LQVFDGTLNYVRQADWNQSRIERAVISTAKNALRPIRPAEATAVTLSRHVSGDTAEHRQAYYSKLLASTTDIVRQSAIHLLENRYAHGSICVVSNRQKLGEADLAVEDLIPQ
jgi:Zn-dependent M16 (insulinase) family peptidase